MTRILYVAVVNLATPKVAARQELLFNKLAFGVYESEEALPGQALDLLVFMSLP